MIPQSQSGTRYVKTCTYLLILTAMACFLAMGCGGGGGDGSAGGGGLTYSGLTTPAAITEDNAKTISAGALESGSSTDGFAGIASLGDPAEPSQGSSGPFLSDVAEAVKEVIQQTNLVSAPDTNARAASEPISETLNGDCGGNASLTANVADSGAFSGSVSFNNFCEGDTTISGSATFEGVVNTGTEEISTFTLNFISITGTSASESYTMHGTIIYRQSGATYNMTMDMAIKDNNKTNYVCKIVGFRMDITERSGSSDVDVSGRFYEPDYGYVDLDTETTLVIDNNAENPSSGVLTLTGELGTAGGPTKAKLTALSSTQCQVEADTNGDGTYDYNSGPMAWSDLENDAS